MAQRITAATPPSVRRTDTRSSASPSRAVPAGLTKHRSCSDIQSRLLRPAPRECRHHIGAAKACPPAVNDGREQVECQDPAIHPAARTDAAPAIVILLLRPVRQHASGPVRLAHLPLPLASAMRAAGTDAPDSRNASLLQRLRSSGPARLSFSGCANPRSRSRVLSPIVLLPPSGDTVVPPMDALSPPKSKLANRLSPASPMVIATAVVAQFDDPGASPVLCPHPESIERRSSTSVQGKRLRGACANEPSSVSPRDSFEASFSRHRFVFAQCLCRPHPHQRADLLLRQPQRRQRLHQLSLLLLGLKARP